ncbi:peptidoglycan recognition family protein [Sulfurimonas sp. HSL3-7]|uniref:N-acetylmuramoyl-L-alanine amidase n=1 Tax=Sulfonitrofixus jiaomeiensis TaxID=3131938 RepID=UPI0031F7BC41
MIKSLLLILTFFTTGYALEIIQKPIRFSEHRKQLTLEYIQTHYGFSPADITIVPRMIVIHYTAIPTLKGSFDAFDNEELPASRSDISGKHTTVNVAVPYLVDRDGTIYQLMPENWMGRHVIGLNYSSIGIENVGNLGDLTPKQLQANIALIDHLTKTYSSIEYLIGHSEYRCFEKSPLWLEKDRSYRTEKEDPGEKFMLDLRITLPALKQAPCP